MDTDSELQCSREVVGDLDPVTIWYETSGVCRHPGPFDLDERETCEHWFECVWGKITNSAADPRDPDNPVAHLMLTTVESVGRLLERGPCDRGELGVHSARAPDNDSVYFRLDYQGMSWTWQLYQARIVNRRTGVVAGTVRAYAADRPWEAMFAPSKPVHQLLIGRWVD